MVETKLDPTVIQKLDPTVIQKLDPTVIHTETDLLAAAMHIDRYVMNALNRLDEEFSGIHSLTMNTFKQLNKNKHALNNKITRDKEVPSDDVTSSLERITLYNEQMEEKTTTPTSRLQRLCACCDRSFAFYEAVVEMSTDEAVKLFAQKLASSAHDRIVVLRGALGKECGCDS